MRSFWIVKKGYWRQWWMPRAYHIYYSNTVKGALLRFFDWLSTKDEKMGSKVKTWHCKPQPYKFNEGDTVSINRSKRIGMVMFRFRNKHGLKLYQVRIHKWSALFYESEIANTHLRVYGDVDIKEIEFKCLTDGTYYRRTLPTFFEPFAKESPKQLPTTYSRHAVGI